MIRKAVIVVSGIVQGVYYRYSTKDRADALGLGGTVRNLPNGDVEVVAQGEDSLIQALIDWCRQGPLGARVDRVDVKWGEPTGAFKNFSIRY
ncbi:MAG: acylphosphatase [Syntrophorhabdales bacterium]|jgi:acylphosphatase